MNMIKKNLKKMLVTSAVILLPIIAGLLLWDRLPASMNIHWGADGQPDGSAGKAFAVFGPCLLILAAHWLCILLSAKDLKNQTPKALNLTIWICPMLSLMMHSIMYTAALGLDFNMKLLLFVPMGILFAVMGNYMPKFRRNSTMGIKTVWALADDENWYATHRFAGKSWMAGGLLIIAISCLPWNWATHLSFIVLLTAALAPAAYSWWYHRKQVKAGTVPAQVPQNPRDAAITKYSLIFVAVIFIAVGIFLCVGTVSVTCGEDVLTVDATYWEPIAIDYDDIDAIEFREEDDPGSRVWGLGSLRLLLGTFQNEEFGTYTRYSYTNPESCIVLTVEGKTLVIADRDTESTEAIYNQIIEKIG